MTTTPGATGQEAAAGQEAVRAQGAPPIAPQLAPPAPRATAGRVRVVTLTVAWGAPKARAAGASAASLAVATAGRHCH
jgi:hypothetical protein